MVRASVPCRVDFGGTLDISTFFLALAAHSPSTFNIALDLRTCVTLTPYRPGQVKISSRGFETAEFERGNAPFNHPMGLMFSVVNYFDGHGVHVHIESSSPPKSALGGSSSAAVAMISAFLHALDQPKDPAAIAWLAHYLEASVAGVPCGMQDQLAAAFGGVNQWVWTMGEVAPVFEQRTIFKGPGQTAAFNEHLLVAYCGVPHVSRDVNGQWVRSFIKGESRHQFQTIARLTREFVRALEAQDFERAGDLMNQETQTRLEMTPDVLDNTGKLCFDAARSCGCGARFTGAGGGGCLWAIGPKTGVEQLRPVWQKILSRIETAQILQTQIEDKGIIIS